MECRWFKEFWIHSWNCVTRSTVVILRIKLNSLRFVTNFRVWCLRILHITYTCTFRFIAWCFVCMEPELESRLLGSSLGTIWEIICHSRVIRIIVLDVWMRTNKQESKTNCTNRRICIIKRCSFFCGSLPPHSPHIPEQNRQFWGPVTYLKPHMAPAAHWCPPLLFFIIRSQNS